MSTVATVTIAFGWVAGVILLLVGRPPNVVVVLVYLGVGLISVTSAWTARYVPDRGLARALLYLAIIGAILAGLLVWVFGRL